MPKIFDPTASHLSTSHKLLRDPSDPRLHVPSRKCDPHSTKTMVLAQLLMRFHHYLGGFGIAAPQIGENVRMCIVRVMPDFPKSLEGSDIVLLNPRVVHVDDNIANLDWYIEGCLSNPGIRAEVARPKAGVIEYQGLGSTKKQRAEVTHPMTFRIISHEINHLDGKLFSELPYIRNIQIVTNEQEGLIDITRQSYEDGVYDLQPDI